MRIAIAADHNGVALKSRLLERLAQQGHDVTDRGTDGSDEVDYPVICQDLARQILGGHADRGIMIGGTGSGEQVACNKMPGIRASLCHRGFMAEIARAHTDSNLLVLGAKVVAPDLADRITATWLDTPFKGGRHRRRLDQIAAIERGETLG